MVILCSIIRAVQPWSSTAVRSALANSSTTELNSFVAARINDALFSDHFNVSSGLNKLVHRLFKSSIRALKALKSSTSTSRIILKPAVEYRYKLDKINTKLISYSECLEAGRSSTKVVEGRRKPLSELLRNTVRKDPNNRGWKRKQRALRIMFGCRLCQIPLCKEGGCWRAYIARVNTKN